MLCLRYLRHPEFAHNRQKAKRVSTSLPVQGTLRALAVKLLTRRGEGYASRTTAKTGTDFSSCKKTQRKRYRKRPRRCRKQFVRQYRSLQNPVNDVFFPILFRHFVLTDNFVAYGYTGLVNRVRVPAAQRMPIGKGPALCQRTVCAGVR